MNPIEIGKRIKEQRIIADLTQEQLGDTLGLNKSTIQRYETGQIDRIKLSILQHIAKVLNVNPDWLACKTDIKTEYSIRNSEFAHIQGNIVSIDNILGRDENIIPVKPGIKIPVLGNVAAGIPIEAIQDIIDYEEIDEEMAKKGEYFGLKIKGDSMEPRIQNGDVVIVRKQETADSGDTAIILVNGNDATVKKIKLTEDGITLIPNNPAYDIKFYTKKEIEALPVRIIGKVVELRGKF